MTTTDLAQAVLHLGSSIYIFLSTSLPSRSAVATALNDVRPPTSWLLSGLAGASVFFCTSGKMGDRKGPDFASIAFGPFIGAASHASTATLANNGSARDSRHQRSTDDRNGARFHQKGSLNHKRGRSTLSGSSRGTDSGPSSSHSRHSPPPRPDW